MDQLAKHHRINLLLAYYDTLLTDKQKTIMQYYYEQNHSLAEIADNEGISRNAVHDQIQKTIKKLESLEDNLALVKKAHKRHDLLNQLKSKINDETLIALIEELEKVD